MSRITADEARRLIEEANYWWAQTGYSGSAVDRLLAAAPRLASEVERLSAELEKLAALERRGATALLRAEHALRTIQEFFRHRPVPDDWPADLIAGAEAQARVTLDVLTNPALAAAADGAT